MAETVKSPESFQHQVSIQFSDGRIGLGFTTPGDRIVWGEHTHADPEASPLDTVIVRTTSGQMAALGRGTMIILPELDRKTGKFGEVGQEVRATRIAAVWPQGLPEIVIGKPWGDITPNDPIDSVLLDYKSGAPGFPGTEQVDMPNPFDSAKAHLQRVDEVMTARGM